MSTEPQRHKGGLSRAPTGWVACLLRVSYALSPIRMLLYMPDPTERLPNLETGTLVLWVWPMQEMARILALAPPQAALE